MLALKNRLTEKKDYSRVQKLGSINQGDSFGLAIFNRKDQDPPRFGFVISKNVSPNASKRNYIKRALSESLVQNMYNIKEGFDCVFLVKPTASTKYMTDLMPEVVEILRKSKLLRS